MTAAGARSASTGGPPPVGGLAEEAAQLLDAIATRLSLVRNTIGDGTPVEPVGSVPEAEPATGHLQCVGWCPVCRSADLLRGERPEVAGKLVDSAMVVVAALRSLLPVTPAGPDAAGPSAADPTADQPAAFRPGPTGGSGDTPPPGIERIDIR